MIVNKNCQKLNQYFFPYLSDRSWTEHQERAGWLWGIFVVIVVKGEGWDVGEFVDVVMMLLGQRHGELFCLFK